MIALLCACLAASGIAATDTGRSAKKQTTKGKASPTPVDPREEQAQQTAERARLAERIEALKKDIAAGEKSRAGAAAALTRAEQALAEVDRRLARLDQRQREAEQRALDLDRQRAGTESAIAGRRADLAAVARQAYLNGYEEPLQLSLTGRDPNGPLLTDAWLGYVARARLAELAALNGQASDLQARRQKVDAENHELAEQAEAQKSARESLASTRLAQQEALAKLSKKIAEQRGTASALAADEQRLAGVIDRLQKLIDRQAAEDRARRELAQRRAEQQAAARQKKGTADAAAPKSANAPTPQQVEPTSEPSAGTGEFAQLRGRLGFPARGALTARYGAPRGDGGASWKGIFIRTEAGAEVRAVAAGRVVFSDYLRGFGNLLIVDHGDQYLSIYGNNDTLIKHAGDAVKAGEVVSRAGSSSGDQDTGLYFELRYRGKPFDPIGWIGPR